MMLMCAQGDHTVLEVPLSQYFVIQELTIIKLVSSQYVKIVLLECIAPLVASLNQLVCVQQDIIVPSLPLVKPNMFALRAATVLLNQLHLLLALLEHFPMKKDFTTHLNVVHAPQECTATQPDLPLHLEHVYLVIIAPQALLLLHLMSIFVP